jgi:hypothetical protein
MDETEDVRMWARLMLMCIGLPPGFFPWLLVFLGCVWVCMCLGLYALHVFPRFF